MSTSDGSNGDDRVVVEFPATAGYRGVGRLVLGGLSSRLELPVDRVEELLLALESLITQELAADTVTMEAVAATSGLRARVGPFASSQMADEGVVRVLKLSWTTSRARRAGGYWVELGVSAGPSGNDAVWHRARRRRADRRLPRGRPVGEGPARRPVPAARPQHRLALRGGASRSRISSRSARSGSCWRLSASTWSVA